MKNLEKYLQTISNEEHRGRLRQIFTWILKTFPSLEYKTLWNQPMFVAHGTFIIGFSASKEHFSVSPEAKGMEHFSKEIAKSGYTQTKNLFRIKWSDPINFDLLQKIINFNLQDKANYTDFWRK